MKPRLAKSLLVIAGMVFAMLLCEAGLRLQGIEYPDFYDYDIRSSGRNCAQACRAAG